MSITIFIHKYKLNAKWKQALPASTNSKAVQVSFNEKGVFSSPSEALHREEEGAVTINFIKIDSQIQIQNMRALLYRSPWGTGCCWTAVRQYTVAVLWDFRVTYPGVHRCCTSWANAAVTHSVWLLAVLPWSEGATWRGKFLLCHRMSHWASEDERGRPQISKEETSQEAVIKTKHNNYR